MENSLERRRWLVPLLLALLGVIFFRHVLLPEEPGGALTGHDLRDQFYPWLSFVAESLRSGQLSLWNPYVNGGTPAIANPQLGMFYPPNALVLLVGVQRGLSLLLVLHVWWGAWGMAKLARTFGASALGGLLAGIIFGFSSQFMVRIWAGHYTFVLVAAWGPWVLAAYRHALARGTWLSALPGAAALGLALLAGHPPMLLYVATLLAALWAYHLAETIADGDPLRPALGLATRQLALVVIGGALLGAVQLAPSAELAALSTRGGGLRPEFADQDALPGAQLLTLLLPNLLGTPNLEEWGFWGGQDFEEVSSGFASLFAIFAALLALRLKKRAAYFFWVVALVGLLLSLGLSGGLLVILYRWLPIFRLFRAPSRALYAVVIALAALSALALTYLQSASAEERREFLRPALRVWLPVAAILVFGGAFVLLALWSLEPPDTAFWRLWHMANAAGEAGLMIVGVGLSLWLWREDGPRAVEWASLATLAVVVIDLWRVGLPLVTVGRVEDFHGIWHEVYAASIPAHDPTFRLMTGGDPQHEMLTANGAMLTGYYNVNGYDPVELERYLQFRSLSSDPTATNNRLWGVRYVTTLGPYDEQEGFNHDVQPTLVSEGGYNIYEVEGGLRAFLPERFEVQPDDDAARARLLADDFDPARDVILDREPGCPVSGTGGTATFGAYTLNRVTLDVQADGPGLLVLTDHWYPGWTATLDSAPVEVLRADTLFRAVCVPGGEHSLTFQFRPLTWRVGAGLSLVGWCAFLVFGILSRRAKAG